MKRVELSDHIRGSYLKKQYLEAFLVQGAYIEGLLKIFADYSYWKVSGEKIKNRDPLTEELRRRISRYGLNELVDFLHRSNLINGQQKSALNTYRERRNKALHDLVKQISSIEFEKELKATCDLGDKIMDDERFKEIEGFLDNWDRVEEESIESSRPNNSSKKEENSSSLIGHEE